MNEPSAGLRPTGHPIGLRRHLRPHVADGAVVLVSERGVTALSGANVEVLVPLLDGTRDRAGVVGDCGLPPERAATLIDRLATAGLVVEHGFVEHEDRRDAPATADPAAAYPAAAAAPDRAALAYWDAAGLDALAAARRISAATVAVHAVDGAATRAVVAALERAGLGVVVESGADAGAVAAAPAADLAIVLCCDYTDPRIDELAAALDAAGTTWVLARPVGEQVRVGPFFVSGEGACWTCLATRLRENQTLADPSCAPRVVLPSVTGLAANIVALECAKWLAGQRHDAQRKIWECDTMTMATRTHHVARRPQCGQCGDATLVARRATRPVDIQSRPKAAGGDGGHRSATPAQTLQRYRHLVSPVSGVVREVRRDPRGPELLNCFRSGVNVAARRHDGVRALRAALRSDNAGKGSTPEQAEVGALCEAVERHSGTFHGDEAMTLASYAQLGGRALHPDTCRLQDPRQVAARAAWNRRHSAFQQVTEAFDEHAALPWTPVWSLTRRTHRLLPTGMLYYDAPGPASVAADSNGCAAGSSIEDAVLQGLLELVERDAVAIWWYNRLRMPAVDLDALGDPWVAAMRTAYTELGREFWVLDVTSDLGIPAMVAVSRRTGGADDILFGFGAHLDPAVALRRALTELNQTVPAMLGMTAAKLRETGDVDFARWLTHATVENQPYLTPEPAAPPRHVEELPSLAAEDLATDVTHVVDRLEAADMEVLVLDQTRPDVGMPVVRTIVPGMRHFWARFAPGRLFDVPVRLGRRAAPTAFDDLNPFPIFL